MTNNCTYKIRTVFYVIRKKINKVDLTVLTQFAPWINEHLPKPQALRHSLICSVPSLFCVLNYTHCLKKFNNDLIALHQQCICVSSL